MTVALDVVEHKHYFVRRGQPFDRTLQIHAVNQPSQQ
jgi:hypothetical protein